MKAITRSQLGGIVTQHVRSLHMSRREDGWRHWPWVVAYLVVPGLATVAVVRSDMDEAQTVAAGLLAGVGVLSGLLFQVLAWVSGRVATLADGMGGRAATPYELRLINRLDIARANIAYSSMVSIMFVVVLGTTSMLKDQPGWTRGISAFLLLHLAVTLLLVLGRINSIGQDDRVAALTAHARDETQAEEQLRASS